MLQQLHLQNFRGFESLELDGLRRVNLIVGRNNTGKTSVLEALYLLLKAQSLYSGNPLRGPESKQREHLRWLIGDANSKNEASVYGQWKTQSIPLTALTASVKGEGSSIDIAARGRTINVSVASVKAPDAKDLVRV